MPYRPYKVRPRQKREVSPAQLFFLCRGHDFFEPVPAPDLPAAWLSVRQPVIDWYARECPGCRPWCWWQIEAPMPRACLSGAHDCPQRDQVIRKEKQGRLYYGRPGIFACLACWGETYESQPRFLRKHGLLLPVEESVIPRDLAACDRWAVARYGDNDRPSPWPAGRALQGCRALLDAWH